MSFRDPETSKHLGAQERKQLRWRQAIEPIIGHLKADHRMNRCHLKGETGDRLHALLCAAGYNIQWRLRMMAKKGIAFLQRLYLRLCELAKILPRWPKALSSGLAMALGRSPSLHAEA